MLKLSKQRAGQEPFAWGGIEIPSIIKAKAQLHPRRVSNPARQTFTERRLSVLHDLTAQLLTALIPAPMV
jgi:hypothetical protein